MKTSTRSYTIILEPAEEGGYIVSVPVLPGCMTEGDTVEEAMAMTEEAIQVWIETIEEDRTTDGRR